MVLGQAVFRTYNQLIAFKRISLAWYMPKGLIFTLDIASFNNGGGFSSMHDGFLSNQMAERSFLCNVISSYCSDVSFLWQSVVLCAKERNLLILWGQFRQSTIYFSTNGLCDKNNRFAWKPASFLWAQVARMCARISWKTILESSFEKTYVRTFFVFFSKTQLGKQRTFANFPHRQSNSSTE